MNIYTRLNKFGRDLAGNPPWTNVYGLARSVLAMGTCLTLLVNDPVVLFPFRNKLPASLFPLTEISIFHLLISHLHSAKWLAVIFLLAVVVGWRPRITGLLHWWVCYSFFSSSPVVDGGDHVASIITLLLVPICLTDPRKWHWESLPAAYPKSKYYDLAAIGGWFCVSLIRLQVSIIYLHAAVAKFKVYEWVNGTAVYYWSLHPYHGAPSWLRPFLLPLMSNPMMVIIITWGTLIFELLLFTAIVIDKTSRKRLLLLSLGILFHFLIVLVHGLFSFFFTMAAALMLYLLPWDRGLEIPHPKWKVGFTGQSPVAEPMKSAPI